MKNSLLRRVSRPPLARKLLPCSLNLLEFITKNRDRQGYGVLLEIVGVELVKENSKKE